MFLGFSFDINSFLDAEYNIGMQILSKMRIIVKDLSQYLVKGSNALSGAEIEDDWFPEYNCDIFLSHSHKDKEKAIAFSGWIKQNFDLNVFIDSAVWGNSNDLLKTIDEEYCENDYNGNYDYHKRNFSTSHVYIMLTMALAKMIDKFEIVIFLNNENTIQPISDTIHNTTDSPWIYSELILTNLVEKRTPLRNIKKSLDLSSFYEAKSLEINHDVNEYINKLIPLTEENLKVWKQSYNRPANIPNAHPLNYLYSQFQGIKEML